LNCILTFWFFRAAKNHHRCEPFMTYTGAADSPVPWVPVQVYFLPAPFSAGAKDAIT